MMDVQYVKWWSPSLARDMEMKIYGSAGKPILVFPSMNGRFFEFEDFGMVDSAAWYIENQKIQLFTVDSVDSESWTNEFIHPSDRARSHEEYDRYICNEVVAYVHNRNRSENMILTTGCSMGGYHSLNFFLRHPDLFDGVISLSGVASLNLFVGDFVDDTIYLNSPLLYLKNLMDETYLKKYRESKIVICSGQGAYEEQTLAEMREIAQILAEKNVPVWLDVWGYDVVHDWPWWRIQFPYFLEKLHFNE